jgi:hypothetical protein
VIWNRNSKFDCRWTPLFRKQRRETVFFDLGYLNLELLDLEGEDTPLNFLFALAPENEFFISKFKFEEKNNYLFKN